MKALDLLEAVVGNLAARVREEILAWADREEAKAKERKRQLATEAKEAEDWLIQQVTGGKCVHTPHREMNDEYGKWVYCDDCPLGKLHDGPISYEAGTRLCSRSRHYSK